MVVKAPKGTSDLLPADYAAWEAVRKRAFEIFSRFGYKAIETPTFEQTELFVRGIGQATDVVGKEMFHVLSGGNLEKVKEGQELKAKSQLALRPEGTAGVVRCVLEHDLAAQGSAPVKLMYAGCMFRAEQPQKGRYRQFRQIGVECLGATHPSIDAEAIVMLMDFYESIGIPRSDMRLLLNSMGCDECRPAYRDLVAAFIKEHAEQICPECLQRAKLNPLRAFDCKNEGCAQVMAKAPAIIDHLCESCASHHNQVKTYLDASQIGYVEDTSLVRGLDYYTQTVFEIQVDNGMGSQNAIGGGGRYDKLAEELGGKPTCGLGFALGYERCMLALEAAGVSLAPEGSGPVFLARCDDEVSAFIFDLALRLRRAGKEVELDHQGRSVKSQLKLANKLGACAVWFVGSADVAAGVLPVRLMDAHVDAHISLADLDEYLACAECERGSLPYNEDLRERATV